MDFKMRLTPKEIEILEGKHGETLKKALKSVVLYGETFGAEELVDITGPVHLVTSFGIPILEPVFDMMEELISEGLLTKEKFTVDPRPIDYENVKANLLEKIVFKIMYGKQKEYESQLKKVGLKDDNSFTCTCYLPEVGNIPKRGDILSWAESSAVVYANSVIGARTNRNSGIIELLSGIVGKTPKFGFLTDGGRRAKWLIELKTSFLPNPQVLGSAIGMKVMEDVPYIAGLDRFLGNNLSDDVKDYLKDMGAASASNGAVGLYHVENLTPEAVDFKRELLLKDYNTYIIDDSEIERIIKSYPLMWKSKDAKPSLCFIGCPHLSLNQLKNWTEKISKELEKRGNKKLKVNTILCAAPDVIEEFKKDSKNYEKLISSGVKLTYICPLMYMNNPLCSKKAVITNSNKLRTYSTARFYTDDEILNYIF
ncbi:predicted aconitase subunit 1 [Caloramator quimbayensis]|uniref:Predicted aconitase subunit 1 n=1 Tax=Caloramator quimbayensis TaxID=1147123 RepID=A0A1T4WKP7_9CLOT|nr:aconitase X [Caloramator quimbayensis]SKA77737.1 predicted aconitase subunit 1 [Caloramator quimbayensis]